MHKKFEANRTKIKGGCQSETNVAELISNSELPQILLKEITDYYNDSMNPKDKSDNVWTY